MNILAFETATPTGGVALIVDGKLAGERLLHDPQAHSRRCLTLAGELLAQSQLDWNRIDIYAASHGPGSFTGVRIGLTLAKALAYAHTKKLVTVSTLDAMARHAWDGEPVHCVVPLIDARMDEIYAAIYLPAPGRALERITEPFCAHPRDLPARLPGTALFSGEGARKYAPLLIPAHGILAQPDRLGASPAAVANLALEQARAGNYQDPAAAHALYLRDAVQLRNPPR